MTDKVDPKALKLPKDIVSEHRNWTIRVNNELEAEQKWSNQWGFYEKGTYLCIQASPPKRPRSKRTKQSTTESSSSSRNSIVSTGRCFRLLPPPMEKEAKCRSIRIANTTSTKTTT